MSKKNLNFIRSSFALIGNVRTTFIKQPCRLSLWTKITSALNEVFLMKNKMFELKKLGIQLTARIFKSIGDVFWLTLIYLMDFQQERYYLRISQHFNRWSTLSHPLPCSSLLFLFQSVFVVLILFFSFIDTLYLWKNKHFSLCGIWMKEKGKKANSQRDKIKETTNEKAENTRWTPRRIIWRIGKSIKNTWAF